MPTAIQCWELLDSMSGSVTNDSEQGEVREVKRRYLIGPCEGFNDTVTQITAYAPDYVDNGGGLYWVRKRLDVNSVGNQYFDCTASYDTLQPKQGREDDNGGNGVPGAVSWDTSGHTEHKTQAFGQSRYPPSAPDFEKAINVSGNAVNGIDVVAPGMKYSETWIMPISVAMSCTFIGAIHSLTGTVNDAAFRCFDPGEVLFLGARGQWSGDQPYVAITFEFEARPNVQVNLDDALGVSFDKDGWQYMWFLYETAEDADRLIQRPIAVYVDTIYERKPWTDLLITAVAPCATLQAQTALPPVAPSPLTPTGQ